MIRRCRLSEAKQRGLMLMFSVGATARAAARAVGVNRNTSSRIFRIFRVRIAVERLRLAPFVGRCEVDECYLSGGKGGRRVARRGRSLAGKFAVVGVAQRDAVTGARRVHFEEVKSVNTATLSGFARRNIELGAEVHTDFLASYRLRALGYNHKRVNHSLVYKDFKTGACTNNIESAWAMLRRHLSRFCGGWRHKLELWLKEIEMRFECGVDGFYCALRRLFPA